MDDPYVSCPYDKHHRVSRSRIQAHIVKCQKKYSALSICPYNATHRVPEDDLRSHVHNCPSRKEAAVEESRSRITRTMFITPSAINIGGYDDLEWDD